MEEGNFGLQLIDIDSVACNRHLIFGPLTELLHNHVLKNMPRALQNILI